MTSIASTVFLVFSSPRAILSPNKHIPKNELKGGAAMGKFLAWALCALISSQSFGVIKHEALVGGDDKQYVDVYDGAFAMSKGIAEIADEAVVKLNGCSGTLIDNRHVLTAEHCKPRRGDPVTFERANA